MGSWDPEKRVGKYMSNKCLKPKDSPVIKFSHALWHFLFKLYFYSLFFFLNILSFCKNLFFHISSTLLLKIFIKSFPLDIITFYNQMIK